jgi:hypothetical protein
MGQTLPVRSEAGKMCRFQENRAEMIDDENEKRYHLSRMEETE